MQDIKIGLLGFGTIGAGVVKLLSANSALLEEKTGTRISLKSIVDLDITTDRGATQIRRTIEKLRSGYVVIVTRGHTHDIDVLVQALGTSARYIGLMASRRKRTKIVEALTAAGFGAVSGGRHGAVRYQQICLKIINGIDRPARQLCRVTPVATPATARRAVPSW